MSDYHDYLTRKSGLGSIYRSVFLFPKLKLELRDMPTLDVGSGLGDFLFYAPLGSAGVDINAKNVLHAQNNNLQVSLCTEYLPFADSTWEQILCDQVLEHLINPLVLIYEMKRILIPSGQILLGVPGKKGFSRDPDHKKFIDHDSLYELMTSSGFEYISHFYYPLPSKRIGDHLRFQSLYMKFAKPLFYESSN